MAMKLNHLKTGKMENREDNGRGFWVLVWALMFIALAIYVYFCIKSLFSESVILCL